MIMVLSSAVHAILRKALAVFSRGSTWRKERRSLLRWNSIALRAKIMLRYFFHRPSRESARGDGTQFARSGLRWLGKGSAQTCRSKGCERGGLQRASALRGHRAKLQHRRQHRRSAERFGGRLCGENILVAEPVLSDSVSEHPQCVIPAKAGIHCALASRKAKRIPAFAGMTVALWTPRFLGNLTSLRRI